MLVFCDARGDAGAPFNVPTGTARGDAGAPFNMPTGTVRRDKSREVIDFSPDGTTFAGVS
jgi:hypothetical protein